MANGEKGTLVECDYDTTGAVHERCWREYLASPEYKEKCDQVEARRARWLAWEDAGRNLKARAEKRRAEGDQLCFELGDWLVQGEDEGFTGNLNVESKYYDKLEDLTGYKRASLQKFAYVARHVPACIRVCNLTWAHHQLVAPLEHKQQEVMLKSAADHKQCVRDTRKMVNEYRAKQQQQGKPSTVVPTEGVPPCAVPAQNIVEMMSQRSLAKWIWRTTLAFEAKGVLSRSAERIFAEMNSTMRSDVLRIGRLLVPWFQAIDTSCNTVDNRNSSLIFCSQSLLKKHCPAHINDFLGLETSRRVLSALAHRPFTSAYCFVGPAGVGKSSMSLALAADMGAELHHIRAKTCNQQTVDDLFIDCQYVPIREGRASSAHVIVVEEADQMTPGAQVAFLSLLDETVALPNITVFIFTTNSVKGLEARFLSRCQVLEFDTEGIAENLAEWLKRVWLLEHGDSGCAPDFAGIVRDCQSNVRTAFKRLELELMLMVGSRERPMKVLMKEKNVKGGEKCSK